MSRYLCRLTASALVSLSALAFAEEQASCDVQHVMNATDSDGSALRNVLEGFSPEIVVEVSKGSEVKVRDVFSDTFIAFLDPAGEYGLGSGVFTAQHTFYVRAIGEDRFVSTDLEEWKSVAECMHTLPNELVALYVPTASVVIEEKSEERVIEVSAQDDASDEEKVVTEESYAAESNASDEEEVVTEESYACADGEGEEHPATEEAFV